MYAKRLNSKKRHWVGAAIGAGTSIVGGLINNAKAKKQKDEAEKKARQQLMLQEMQLDQEELENHNYRGTEGVQYYKSGGKLATSPKLRKSVSGYKTKGGSLLPISSDVEEAVGNKHTEKNIDNSYGITLNKDGKDVAEIEDKEVVSKGDLVFSEQLKYDKSNSFAKKMKQIGEKRAKLEEKLEATTKKAERNTIERQLAGLNMAEEALFTNQEISKYQEGNKELEKMDGSPRKMAKGDKINWGNVANNVAPALADNVTNMLLTSSAPDLAVPTFKKARSFKTKLNYTPQVNNIKKQTKATVDNIMKNTSNSNVARNAVAKARLSGTEQENKVLADKENRETNLYNADKQNKQSVSAVNTDIVNRNNYDRVRRASEVQSQISANVANLSRDVRQGITNDALSKVDDERMLLDIADDKTGSKARAYLSNPVIKERIKNDPVFRQRLIDIGIYHPPLNEQVEQLARKRGTSSRSTGASLYYGNSNVV